MGITDEILNGTYDPNRYWEIVSSNTNNKKKKKTVAEAILDGTYNADEYWDRMGEVAERNKLEAEKDKLEDIAPTKKEYKTIAEAMRDGTYELPTIPTWNKVQQKEDDGIPWYKKILQVPENMKDNYRRINIRRHIQCRGILG